MCDHLKENGGKCCGECSREKPETDDLIKCGVCEYSVISDEITKDWQASGWDVCDNCLKNGDAMKALAEDVATSSDPHTKLIANAFISMVEADQRNN